MWWAHWSHPGSHVSRPSRPIWTLLGSCRLIFMYVRYIYVYKTPRVVQNSNIFTYFTYRIHRIDWLKSQKQTNKLVTIHKLHSRPCDNAGHLRAFLDGCLVCKQQAGQKWRSGCVCVCVVVRAIFIVLTHGPQRSTAENTVEVSSFHQRHEGHERITNVSSHWNHRSADEDASHTLNNNNNQQSHQVFSEQTFPRSQHSTEDGCRPLVILTKYYFKIS